MNTDNNNKQIFLSYSRHNSDYADIIEKDFTAYGLTIQRDIRDLPYRGSIKEFMHRIQDSDFVIMLISDEFIKSQYCMYEVMELLNSHDFDSKILPIILDSADNIFNVDTRISYYNYWSNELISAESAIKKNINEDLLDYTKRVRNINNQVDIFLKKITDLNLFPFEKLKQESYLPILDIIGSSDQYLLNLMVPILETKDSEEREIALDKFLVRFPNNSMAMLQLSWITLENKRYKKTKYLYDEMLRIQPDNFYVHSLYGRFAEDILEDYDLAKYHYCTSFEMQPNWNQARFDFGRLLETKFKDYKGARENYEAAMHNGWKNEMLYFQLGSLLASRFNEYETGKEYLKKSLEYNPDSINSYYNLAMLAMRVSDDYLEAIEYLRKVIEFDSNDKFANLNLALIYKNQVHDYEKSAFYYEKTLEADPEDADARFDYAMILKDKLLDYKNADTQLHIIRDMQPDNKWPPYLIAQIYYDILEEKDLAKPYYIEATNIDPGLANSTIDAEYNIKR